MHIYPVHLVITENMILKHR